MVDEVRLDEVLMQEALKMVDVGGECENRLLFHIILQILEMGYRHRAEYRVVLFNRDAEADFDEEYAAYLDLKAQREDVAWGQDEEE